MDTFGDVLPWVGCRLVAGVLRCSALLLLSGNLSFVIAKRPPATPTPCPATAPSNGSKETITGSQGERLYPVKKREPDDRGDYYQRHIIAVDSNGSALLPIVTCHQDVHGNRVSYSATAKVMDGEDAMDLHADPNDPQRDSKERRPYYRYIYRIFSDIAYYHPKHIVIYVHGGMNFVTGAIAKGAELADECRGHEDEEYRISICWSSNLFSTYWEHLGRNVEGLDDPGQATTILPLTLLGDMGGAIVHGPTTIFRLLMNDAHAADQKLFHRDRLAYGRELELEQKKGVVPGPNLNVSLSQDKRASRQDAEIVDVTAWLATSPAKMATAPLIDELGGGAWQMMLRRTRTMFERETSFTARYFESPERRRQFKVNIVDGRPVLSKDPKAIDLDKDGIAVIEKVIFLGRRGAIRMFFELAEKELGLSARKAERPCYGDVTLIGHSMGAIVVNEILARFGRLHFDNIVFMAAACTTNDFLRLGVPYLERNHDTRFYDLCLHPSAERAEAQPGKLMIADPIYFPLELAPRGSLLVWIDSFLDHPDSEGDRTFGRWENAILASDIFPEDILDQVSIKAFGRDRSPDSANINYSSPGEAPDQTSGGLIPRKYINEPRQHGDFPRFSKPANKNNPNFNYTEPCYWAPEQLRKSSP